MNRRVRHYREKQSFGVACCRYTDRLEILLVRKKYTYAYNLFIHGKYNSSSNEEIIKLMNDMTVEEKTDLLSLKFEQIWYRVWMNTPKTPAYYVSKNKFDTTFLLDSGNRLRKLLSRSTSADYTWEIPKGRKNAKIECDIHCAIREFKEETGVSKKSYDLTWAKLKSVHDDQGVKYVDTYYLAYTRHQWDPRIRLYTDKQAEEVADIRWMDIRMVKLVDNTGRLYRTTKRAFAFMRKHVLTV